MRTECMKGGLWFTMMGRIVLDDHNGETYIKGSDIKLMSREELTRGIGATEFSRRLEAAKRRTQYASK